MYANFAGRDASRGMAKQSFDEGVYFSYSYVSLKLNVRVDMLTPLDQPLDKLDDLTPDEM